MASTLLLLALHVIGGSAATVFSYDQCNQTSGPSAWAAPCTPNQVGGTPINICGTVPFTNGAPAMLVDGYNKSRGVTEDIQVEDEGQVTSVNNMYTIQIGVSAPQPTLQLGNIAQIVRPEVAAGTTTWAMEQMHLHWGRTDKNDEGSEHYLEGRRFPLEAHMVHYNTALGRNVTAAVRTGRADALLVVGIFLALNSTDVPLMTAIANRVSSLTKTPEPLGTNITLSDLFDGTGSYYSYAGGLTTPTCNSVVTWVVMKDPKPITQATLNLIKAASSNPGVAGAPTISLYGNYRPLQARGNRTVYTSVSTAGAACGTVTEPTWQCGSTPSFAAPLQPSLLSPLVALLSAALVSASWH